MSTFQITDLIVGATYSIDYQDGDHSWAGHATFVRANPDGYPHGTLEFNLVKSEDGCDQGFFGIEDVKALVSLPVTLTQRAERIVDLLTGPGTENLITRAEMVRLIEQELSQQPKHP